MVFYSDVNGEEIINVRNSSNEINKKLCHSIYIIMTALLSHLSWFITWKLKKGYFAILIALFKMRKENKCSSLHIHAFKCCVIKSNLVCAFRIIWIHGILRKWWRQWIKITFYKVKSFDKELFFLRLLHVIRIFVITLRKISGHVIESVIVRSRKLSW